MPTNSRSLPKEKVHSVSKLDRPYLEQEKEHDLPRLSDLQVQVRESVHTEDIPPALLLTIWSREKQTHQVWMTDHAARRLVVHLKASIRHYAELHLEPETETE